MKPQEVGAGNPGKLKKTRSQLVCEADTGHGILYTEETLIFTSAKRLCFELCLFVCLSVCLFVCLFVYLFVRLFVCLHICLSICLSVCLSACLFVARISQNVLHRFS